METRRVPFDEGLGILAQIIAKKHLKTNTPIGSEKNNREICGEDKK